MERMFCILVPAATTAFGSSPPESMPALTAQDPTPPRQPGAPQPGAPGGPTAGRAADALVRIAEAVNTELRARTVRVGAPPSAPLPPLSTGFPALDAATGVGGLPRGRITELIGRPTSGRETVAARAVAASRGPTAWVDVRGLVDVHYLQQCGADLTQLFILRPPEPLDALAITAQLAASRQFETIVLDALADLPPGGPTARAVEQLVRVVTPALGRAATVCLVLSGPDSHHPALAHAAAVRIALVKVGLIHQGGAFRGWRTRARLVKPPGAPGNEPGLEVWLT